MGIPIYTENIQNDIYTNIFKKQLTDGVLYSEVVKIDGVSKRCVFYTGVSGHYIFWIQNSFSDILLELYDDKTLTYQPFTGYITRTGQLFCESILHKKNFGDYLNSPATVIL